MADFAPLGMGWHPDVPDLRDLSIDSPPVRALLDRLPTHPVPTGQYTQVDLREYFPAARDQMQLNASSAHTALGLYQYFARRALGQAGQLSHLFVYATMRRLMRTRGNIGGSLRTAFKALVGFGAPPESYWPYEIDRLDDLPDGFLYSFPNPLQGLVYFRLDRLGDAGADILQRVKALLHAGFPVALGFAVPSSLTSSGDIPFRPRFDAVQGGQAVVAVGYDDDRFRNPRGALLVRNSWGTDWGEAGYGWLPYAYVVKRLAMDFWAMLRLDWLESGEFFRPLTDI